MTSALYYYFYYYHLYWEWINLNSLYCLLFSRIGTNNNRDFLVTMKSEFPNLPLQYSFDGGITWSDYGTPFILKDVNQVVHLRTL